jgi:hypothetical protein
MYSSTFRRAADGSSGDERMRLMITDEGPARLSRFSNTQAVGRGTPSAAACLAVVSYPAVTNVSRSSASFDACLCFALDGKTRGRSMCGRMSFAPLNQESAATGIIGGFPLTKRRGRLGLSERNQLVLVTREVPRLASSSAPSGLTRRAQLKRVAGRRAAAPRSSLDLRPRARCYPSRR